MSQSIEQKQRLFRNIILLGAISFFTDVHSEIILPLLPLFLSQVLHASTTYIGLIEGIAEATANIVKGFSGWISDAIRKRKVLIISGYTLSFFTRALLVLATKSFHVLLLRFMDRIGKGIRTSPRDALIADSSSGDSYGKSFGIHRAMDTLGAVVGSSLAGILMFLLSGDVKLVFLVAIIPGVVSVLLTFIITEVKPSKREAHGEEFKNPKKPTIKKDTVPVFLGLGLFYLSYMSYAFYILKLKDLGFSNTLVPIAYLIYNIVYTLLSIPAGRISDRLGRRKVMVFGITGHVVLCAGFALADATFYGWILFVLYGLVSSVIETVPKAFVSDITGYGRRGMTFGWYNMVIGLCGLASNMIAGLLWDRVGSSATFVVSGFFAVLSLFVFLMSGISNEKN